jgi:hypothetical protein
MPCLPRTFRRFPLDGGFVVSKFKEYIHIDPSTARPLFSMVSNLIKQRFFERVKHLQF